MLIDKQAYIAMNRFGYGANTADHRALMSMAPKVWLQSQLSLYKLPPHQYNSQKAITAVSAYNELNNRAKKNAALETERNSLRQTIVNDARQFALNTSMFSLQTKQPIQARLLDFFSNHFSLSRNNLFVTALAPTMEYEAIAPNLTNTFAEMLYAVVSHPAMLMYLNNERSFGPNSKIGKRRQGKGLNENLAREILELHTLGVDAGYQQQDVTEFARALTGWSIGRPRQNEPAGFMFRSIAHEPGSRKILGKVYPESTAEDGNKQALAILSDLASHPNTAKHLCNKLAKHFISDSPPKFVIDSMTKAYMQSGANIPKVITAMLNHDLAWLETNEKFKTPREFVISSCRACSVMQPRPNLFQTLELMGQGFFNAGSPAGYPDESAAWSSAQALTTRIEWTSHFVNQLKISTSELANIALGPLLTKKTEQVVARAESQSQALTLLLLSPEFQRR